MEVAETEKPRLRTEARNIESDICDVPFAASGLFRSVRKAESELKMRCCGSVEILWLRDVRC
jgi:hypothetical protein